MGRGHPLGQEAVPSFSPQEAGGICLAHCTVALEGSWHPRAPGDHAVLWVVDTVLPPQDVVLMRALRDMNLPKFVFEDVPLFLGLISDLFPGLDCPRVRYPDFNDAVEQVLEENGYMILPVQVRRCPHVILPVQ